MGPAGRKGLERTVKLPSLRRIARRTGALALLVALPGTMPGQEAGTATRQAVIAGARLPWSRWPDFSRQVDDVARLYTARAGAPVWVAGSRPSRAAREAIARLVAAAEHGLDPGDYDAATVDSLARKLSAEGDNPDVALRFDLLLTVAFLRFIGDLHQGRAPHPPLATVLPHAPLDLAAAVSAAVDGDSVARFAAAVAPGLSQYSNLQTWLSRYRALAADSSLAALAVVARVLPGDAYAATPALARRLAALGDLPPTSAAPAESSYTGALVEAVRRFQTRHGLAPDGVIGAATFQALNTPLGRRVRQLELALERLRWLPPLRGHRTLVVNIPAFRLFAFDSAGASGGPAVQMRVIVGKALDTRTPVLAEQLRYLEFRPYWNIPRSILVGEILPRLRRRPGYLHEQGMELVGPRDRVVGDRVTPGALDSLARGDLRLRQRPGPRNPLGRVKFVFPNAADVYLHGTPDTTLFARTRRDFSHGCIRVERPADLAAWVLSDQPAWPRDTVDAALAGRRTRRALLTHPMPVILFYATAVAIPGVGVAFYEDIYGHDRRLDEALRAGPTPP